MMKSYRLQGIRLNSLYVSSLDVIIFPNSATKTKAFGAREYFSLEV
jgi:hypothetical protein